MIIAVVMLLGVAANPVEYGAYLGGAWAAIFTPNRPAPAAMATPPARGFYGCAHSNTAGSVLCPHFKFRLYGKQGREIPLDKEGRRYVDRTRPAAGLH